MPKFVNQRVLLCGRKVSQTEGSAIVQAADGKEIKVVLPPGELIAGEFVQVLGKVVTGSELEGLRVQDAGNNFDLDNYNKLVEMSTGKFQALFQ